MASASSFLGGQFIKSETLKASGPVRGVISAVKVEHFEAKGKDPAKDVLSLVIDLGTEEKTLTLSAKTNLRIVIDAYGDDYEKWVGKSIIAYFDPNVFYAGKQTGGVRVKVPTQKAAARPVTEPQEVPESVIDPDIPF